MIPNTVRKCLLTSEHGESINTFCSARAARQPRLIQASVFLNALAPLLPLPRLFADGRQRKARNRRRTISAQ